MNKKATATYSSQHLVETDWLEQNLDTPDLRVLDCTVYLPNYFDESAGEKVEVISGREDYDRGHIPGSTFVDLVGELTDPDNKRFMFPMPSAAQFSASMSRHGVTNDSRVILYDRMLNIWATRVWWMLRHFGFDQAAVLNGGWKKWTDEERPVSADPPAVSPGTFVARSRPELIAAKEDVEAALKDKRTCLVNALDADEYAGRGPVRYGRAGHIPSSVNVSFLDVVDPETNAFLPPAELKQKFAAVGALDADRVITYCGGGIAASSDAFLLTLLGAKDVALYDGSMTEWAAEPQRPLVTIGD